MSLRVRLVAAVALVASLAVVAPAGAQTTQGELQAEIARLTKAQRDQLDKVKEIQLEKDEIDAQVADLDQQLRGAEARLQPLADETARLGGLIADLQARIDLTQAQLDEAKLQLNESVAQMYRSARGGSTSVLGFKGTPNQYLTEQKYLDRLSQERDATVTRVTFLRDDLAGQKKALKVQKDKADALADEARGVRDRIAKLRSDIEPARARAAAEEKRLNDELAVTQQRFGDVLAQYAAYQAASDSIARRLLASPEPGKAGGCDKRPVNVPINSPFGPRWGSLHPGVDMAAPMGTPIVACRAGRVVIAGWQGGYGNAVVIDHGGNMATLYGHQSQLLVQEGDRVAAGQIIGLVGSTGQSTGPHLHFEVRIAGQVVDPELYI